MNETIPHYEAGHGIRPPRKGGKVRGVARVFEPGGGMELWHCDHNHAPKVKSCQDLTDEQRADANACAKQWITEQITAGLLQPLPVSVDGDGAFEGEPLVIPVSVAEALTAAGAGPEDAMDALARLREFAYVGQRAVRPTRTGQNTPGAGGGLVGEMHMLAMQGDRDEAYRVIHQIADYLGIKERAYQAGNITEIGEMIKAAISRAAGWGLEGGLE